MTIAADLLDLVTELDTIVGRVDVLEVEHKTLTKENEDLKAQLAALAASASLAVGFVPADGFGKWKTELSGSKESCTLKGDHVVCKAGGNTASTHYARIRYYLPENDDLVAASSWSFTATIELPSDFYTRKQSYMRLMTTDNYVGKLKSGKTVGCSNGNEWRVGFLVWGKDDLPRLVSGHENREEIILWTGKEKLATGKHTVRIDLTPGYDNDGAWAVWIDGDKVSFANKTPTIPGSVPKAEAIVTRVGAGLDGAADQDTKAIEVSVYGITFDAKKVVS